jgi:hypothetical protein
MQRVVILGRGGAGKSTFAGKLGEMTGLPVIELDKHFWQAGLLPSPRAQWTEIQTRLASEDRWIMDGDLGRYDDLAVGLKAADTVLVLDFDFLLCLRRAISRSREPIKFWWWLANWRWRERPKIARAIAEHAARAEVRMFSKPEMLGQFLDALAAATGSGNGDGDVAEGAQADLEHERVTKYGRRGRCRVGV